MIIASLFKMLMIFFFVYLLVQVFKYVIYFNRNMEQRLRSKKREKVRKESPAHDNGRIIELDKDQYKVE